MEFGGQLNQPRCGRAYDLAEVGIVDLSIDRRRAVKLRVIENIKRLNPEIQRFRFREPQCLA